MCPAGITTAALIVAGATSIGGVTAVVETLVRGFGRLRGGFWYRRHDEYDKR